MIQWRMCGIFPTSAATSTQASLCSPCPAHKAWMWGVHVLWTGLWLPLLPHCSSVWPGDKLLSLPPRQWPQPSLHLPALLMTESRFSVVSNPSQGALSYAFVRFHLASSCDNRKIVILSSSSTGSQRFQVLCVSENKHHLTERGTRVWCYGSACVHWRFQLIFRQECLWHRLTAEKLEQAEKQKWCIPVSPCVTRSCGEMVFKGNLMVRRSVLSLLM